VFHSPVRGERRKRKRFRWRGESNRLTIIYPARVPEPPRLSAYPSRPPHDRQASPPGPGSVPARRRLTTPGVLPDQASSAIRAQTPPRLKPHQAQRHPALSAHGNSPRPAPDRNQANTNPTASKPRTKRKTTHQSCVAISPPTHVYVSPSRHQAPRANQPPIPNQPPAQPSPPSQITLATPGLWS